MIAFPGSSTGSVDIHVSTGSLYEGHLDLTEKALDYGWFRFYSILGYRFYSYQDGVQMNQTLVPSPQFFVPGSQIVTADQFAAHNWFNGIDMGMRTQFVWGPVMLDLLGKVALGNLHQEVNVNGNQVITVPGAPTVNNSSGLFALPTNIGSVHRSTWFPMYEGGATLSWQVLPNLQVRAGYSTMILQGLARSSYQIDTTLNPTFFPGSSPSGAVRPRLQLNRSDVWLQTINLGVMFTF